jgi:hypothetical protein
MLDETMNIGAFGEILEIREILRVILTFTKELEVHRFFMVQPLGSTGELCC